MLGSRHNNVARARHLSEEWRPSAIISGGLDALPRAVHRLLRLRKTWKIYSKISSKARVAGVSWTGTRAVSAILIVTIGLWKLTHAVLLTVYFSA